MTWKFFIVILVLLAAAFYVPAQAASWTAFTVPEYANPLYPGWPDKMVFTLKDSLLSLNTNIIGTQGGSSATAWHMMFSGTWGACGSVDNSGNLLADPYAKFVTDGYGGYIDWASNTPTGYKTSLMLGASFNGNGAATYQDSLGYEPSGQPIKATIVIRDYIVLREGERDYYEQVSHTFNNVKYRPAPIPEPSGVLAVLATGFTAAAGGIRRYIIRRKAD